MAIKQNKQTEVKNVLMDNTVFVDLIFRFPGMYRPVRNQQVTLLNADPNWINGHKRIMRSNYYRKAIRIKMDAMKWVRSRALPNPFNKKGLHLIPLSLLDNVMEKLAATETEYLAAANAFADEYAERKEDAKLNLKDAYSEQDYPSEQTMRAAWAVEWRLIELAAPNGAKVGSTIGKIEQEKAKKKWEEAMESALWILRVQFRELIAHLTDRLASKEDGSRKQLHTSCVEKVQEWIELFNKKNLLEDTELEKLTLQCRQILQGKSVQAIRDDATLRSEVQTQTAAIKTALDSMLENCPARLISFEDEEDE